MSPANLQHVLLWPVAWFNEYKFVVVCTVEGSHWVSAHDSLFMWYQPSAHCSKSGLLKVVHAGACVLLPEARQLT